MHEPYLLAVYFHLSGAAVGQAKVCLLQAGITVIYIEVTSFVILLMNNNKDIGYHFPI